MHADNRAYGTASSAKIPFTKDKKVKQTWKVYFKFFKDLAKVEALVYEYRQNRDLKTFFLWNVLWCFFMIH